MSLAGTDVQTLLAAQPCGGGIGQGAPVRTTPVSRPQTAREEIANSASHGLALLAAVIGIPFLLGGAAHPKLSSVIGLSVFVATMVAVYLSSTIYHALPEGRGKQVFLKLDRSAIYLFIAGTYTPFALGVLAGPWGWSIFAIIWSLAALGVTLTACDRFSGNWSSIGLYLAMGWLVLIAAGPLIQLTPAKSVFLLVAGGLSYTAGVAFFVLDSRFPYAHAIWHVFVIGGTACHYCAVLDCLP